MSLLNFFIIPGNPPALHFYKEWKKEWLALFPDHNIYISSYPDLDIKQNSRDFFEELENLHTQAFLNFHEEIQRPIITVGHSLGGYFANAVTRKHPKLIDKCIFIHPFLRKPETRAVFFLQGLRVARKWNGLENLLLKNKSRIEKINPDLKYVTASEAKVSLKLAYHEAKTIMRDKSKVEIPKDIKDKFYLYYTSNDRWCTPNVIKQLSEQIEAKEVSAAHDFIRLKTERELMTNHMIKLLNLNRPH